MSNKSLEGIKEQLAKCRNVLITSHMNPDGDAVGSTLALYHFFILQGLNATVVLPNSVPDFLEWLPEVNEATIIFDKSPEKAIEKLEQAHIVFCVDFNALNRVGAFQNALMQSKSDKVFIDHHLTPELHHFKYYYSDSSKSSTCEMIYDFIEYLGAKELINQPIMKSLYTGILTDTGSFRFSATSGRVHRIVAEFLDNGLNHTEIHNLIYDSYEYSRMKFLGYVLYEKMYVDEKQGFAYVYITNDELRRFGINFAATEGIVNFPLSIKHVHISVLISERNNGLKLSFRSKGNINVRNLAAEYFEGGGHMNAAGGASKLGWKETREKLIALLPKYIESN